MRKILTALLISLLLSQPVYAGKGGGGGGGGGGGRSFSGGGGGRSFSGGGGGRSFSGGSKPSYSAPKPSTPSGGGKTFSGGSKPSTTTGGKSYSGTSTATKTNTTTNNVSIKPGKTNFDSIGTKEQMKAESRALYNKGNAPKSEYKTSDGKTAKIDPKDAKIERLQGQLDQQKWVNRQQRQETFYGVYYSRPMVIYHDPYPSYFWWWMLDRTIEERAMWAYCHRADMDSARYQAMLAKDAQLEARIKQLERQGTKADPTYVPKGMDRDLMYSNDYVDAVYNPTVASTPTHAPADAGVALKVILWVFGIAFLVWFVWFVFIREI